MFTIYLLKKSRDSCFVIWLARSYVAEVLWSVLMHLLECLAAKCQRGARLDQMYDTSWNENQGYLRTSFYTFVSVDFVF